MPSPWLRCKMQCSKHKEAKTNLPVVFGNLYLCEVGNRRKQGIHPKQGLHEHRFAAKQHDASVVATSKGRWVLLPFVWLAATWSCNMLDHQGRTMVETGI